MFYFLGRFGYVVVVGPVKKSAAVVFIVLGIQLFITRLGKKRLVWIEGLDLQKPVIRRRIPMNEIQARLEGSGLWLPVFVIHEGPVDPVLARVVAQLF